MNFVSLEISLAAVIPALFLAAYVFFHDRVEKEPLGLLSLLFGAGGLSYVVAFFAERVFVGWIDDLFFSFASFDLSGNAAWSTSWAKLGHGVLVTFVGLALVEELFKWLVMFLFTHRNKNFNCLYDGVVYGTFTALGFAASENLFYAWTSGWDTLLYRTLTTLPGHLLFGIIMGCFYTMWRVYRTAGKAEKIYEERGLIRVEKPFSSKRWFAGMLVFPVFYHGLYGLAGYLDLLWFTVLFCLLNLGIFLLCLRNIRKLSQVDTLRGRYADLLLDRKYPEIASLCDNVESGLPEGGKTCE